MTGASQRSPQIHPPGPSAPSSCAASSLCPNFLPCALPLRGGSSPSPSQKSAGETPASLARWRPPPADHPPSIPRKALGPLPTVSCSGDASGLQQRSRWATRWCPRVPSGSSPACWPRPLSHLLLTFIPRALLSVSSRASPRTPTGALGRSRTHGDALLLRRVWLLWRRTHGSWDSPGSHPSLPAGPCPLLPHPPGWPLCPLQSRFPRGHVMFAKLFSPGHTLL